MRRLFISFTERPPSFWRAAFAISFLFWLQNPCPRHLRLMKSYLDLFVVTLLVFMCLLLIRDLAITMLIFLFIVYSTNLNVMMNQFSFLSLRIDLVDVLYGQIVSSLRDLAFLQLALGRSELMVAEYCEPMLRHRGLRQMRYGLHARQAHFR